MPRARLIAVALAACAILPASATGAASARMSVAVTPEHLGAPTTISFGFQIGQADAYASPLTGVELDYPRNLGLATSGLGLVACPLAQLEALGPPACPANSRMGFGNAVVHIRFGLEVVEEAVQLALFAAPSPDGYLHMFVYARGRVPVQAALILRATLLAGHLAVTVPPIPSLPEAPYVSVSQMHLTLGGALTYYEMVKGRRVPYHPAGVGLPSTCPRGGFRFAATFILLDGERVNSHAAVACPRRR